jgi:adenylate cyclase
MSDIFISYSSKDRERANAFADGLRASGYSVWMDTSSIDGAASWSKEIAGALESCLLVCVLLSEHSLASSNVAKELGVAAELEKHFLPIELDPVKLRGEFLYHLANLQRVKVDDLDRIVNAIERFRTREPTIAAELIYPAATTLSVEQDVRKRLVVIPFDDQSPGHDNDWFASGLTDELIGLLTKIQKLFVIDRRTAHEYKGSKLRLKEIAQELSVRFVVTGTVRKAENKIRVQAELIDTTTGDTLWNEKFSGTMDDIFEIQEKTALEIAEGLKVTLTPSEEAKIVKRYTPDPKAYELYLRAREFHFRYGKEDLDKALILYTDAIALDPGFALAHAWCALCYTAFPGRYETPPEYIALAAKFAETALRLDPESADGYYAMCDVYSLRKEYDEQLKLAKRAVEVDPQSPVAYKALGWAYYRKGLLQESAEAYEKAIAIDAGDTWMLDQLIWTYMALGDKELSAGAAKRAIPYFEKLLNQDIQNSNAINYLMRAYTALEDLEGMSRYGNILLASKDPNIWDLYNCACYTAQNGELNESLVFLERIAEVPQTMPEHSKTDPDLDALRALPRFQTLMQKWTEQTEARTHA